MKTYLIICIVMFITIIVLGKLRSYTYRATIYRRGTWGDSIYTIVKLLVIMFIPVINVLFFLLMLWVLEKTDHELEALLGR